MLPDDFCIFILTHKRPDNQITLETLKRGNYSGKVYLVVDDLDPTLPEYQRLYGDKVLTFSKEELSKRIDSADNFKELKGVFYARNACYDLAQELGISEFLQLDDDYEAFRYRFKADLDYCTATKKVKSLDKMLASLLAFYKTNPIISQPISILALAQGGDFIGGSQASFSSAIKCKRKVMNSLFCSVHRRVSWLGRINEDTTTYVLGGIRGDLMLTINQVDISQVDTQVNSGGMTGLYLDNGTYVKSFYSVLFAPSCVAVTEMNSQYKRLHHQINWNNCATKVLREKYKR